MRAAAGVQSAAGLLVIGTVAFSFAFFEQQYLPLQLASSFFLVEFVLRTTLGIRYSPAGVVARRLTRGQAPEWVSAKPKRFAWTVGVAMRTSPSSLAKRQDSGGLVLGGHGDQSAPWGG